MSFAFSVTSRERLLWTATTGVYRYWFCVVEHLCIWSRVKCKYVGCNVFIALASVDTKIDTDSCNVSIVLSSVDTKVVCTVLTQIVVCE